MKNKLLLSLHWHCGLTLRIVAFGAYGAPDVADAAACDMIVRHHIHVGSLDFSELCKLHADERTSCDCRGYHGFGQGEAKSSSKCI